MINRVILALLCLFTFACSTYEKTEPVREIPLKDFFKNSLARAFRLSPDGKKIAVLKPYKDRMNIFVRDIDGKEWTRVTSVTDRDLAGLYWKGNEHLLYTRDFGGDENYHVFVANIKNSKSQDVTPYKNTRAMIMDTLDDISDDEIMISMNKRDKRVFDVYRLNVNTGKLKLIEKNPGNITSWIIDRKGDIRYAVSTDGVNNTLSYRKSNKDKL